MHPTINTRIVVVVNKVDHHSRTPVRPRKVKMAQMLKMLPALQLVINESASRPLGAWTMKNTGSDCRACPQQNSNFSKVDSLITFTAMALSSLFVKDTSSSPSIAEGTMMAKEAIACTL
jgi:hypothetical protein